MRFSERLNALGHPSYASYLTSDHWKDFKARYRASGRPRACAVCGGRKVALHHHTYARLGHERLSDVTPLCREHHTAVHELLKEKKKGRVECTPSAISALREAIAGPANVRKKKQKPPPLKLLKVKRLSEAERPAGESKKLLRRAGREWRALDRAMTDAKLWTGLVAHIRAEVASHPGRTRGELRGRIKLIGVWIVAVRRLSETALMFLTNDTVVRTIRCR